MCLNAYIITFKSKRFLFVLPFEDLPLSANLIKELHNLSIKRLSRLEMLYNIMLKMVILTGKMEEHFKCEKSFKRHQEMRPGF